MGESVNDKALGVIHHFRSITCSQREMPGALAACCLWFFQPLGTLPNPCPKVTARQLHRAAWWVFNNRKDSKASFAAGTNQKVKEPPRQKTPLLPPWKFSYLNWMI